MRRRVARARRYGPVFQKALLVAWEASGYVCSERLQPFLPELVRLLEQHRHLRIDDATRGLLFQASVSTVERALAPKRKHLVGRRMAQTKPGTLLRRQIPALVGPWKAEDVPGYLEIDLVSPSGEYAAGTFLYTLSTVDLATGWTERIPVLGKGRTGIVAGLDRIREQLPFRLRGLHSDTGSEFINFHPFDYCKDRGIEFTRSRPYHKNDDGHVEQKNWTLVRRLIGYERLDTPAQQVWLDAFYTEDLRPFANCFQPVMKLVGKELVGQRTRRHYDTPKTPLRRLLDDYSVHVDLKSPACPHRPLHLGEPADPEAAHRPPPRRAARPPGSPHQCLIPAIPRPFRSDSLLRERSPQGQARLPAPFDHGCSPPLPITLAP